MMKRTISIRELILLGVLVIAVVYYFALHKPLTAQMAEVQAQQTQVNTQLNTVMDKATEMKTMAAAALKARAARFRRMSSKVHAQKEHIDICRTRLLPSRLYCRYRNHTGSCGLWPLADFYRRWGISPRPEDK